MRALRENGLSILFGLLFLAALTGQAVAGFAQNNEDLAQHGQDAVTFVSYVTSSQFVVDVAENWQSEFLQFFVFIAATIWLVQRGSPESKQPGHEGVQTDREERTGRYADDSSPAGARMRGLVGAVYSNSLLLVMGGVFLLSWWVQSLAGLVVFNAENAEHGEPPIDWLHYLGSPDFWSRTLQNWQSEFLAVGSMIALTIFLRQRGSSESKPVGAAHDESAVSAQ